MATTATAMLERLNQLGWNEQGEDVSMEKQTASDGSSVSDSGDYEDDDYSEDGGAMMHTNAKQAPRDEDATTLDSPSGESARAKHEMEISPAQRRRKATSSEPSVAASSTSAAADAKKKTKKPSASSSTKTAQSKPRARKAAAALQSSKGDEQREIEQAAMRAERKQASIDQRRKRNREAMQRARQRDKDYMDGLRDTARDLERKHNALVARVDAQLAVAFTTAGEHARARVAELQQRLQAARDQAEALKRQNLQFLEDIGDRIKREDRMEGLLRELMREQAAQEHALNEIFHASLSESQLSALFFTEERAMREILRSRHDRRQVERCGFAGAATGELFGWSTQHQVADRAFHFSFAKTFRNQHAARVMEQNWQNAMQMVSYRSAADAATQRWYVVQRINDDTYLLARELSDPACTGEVIRLLYLRFRLHEADGSFSVVTQSVQDAAQQQALLHDGVRDVWATEACMWTLFTPVRERASDGSELEHCHIRMVGSSTVGSAAAARQNVLDTILGLLRWENLNVGPVLSLTNT